MNNAYRVFSREVTAAMLVSPTNRLRELNPILMQMSLFVLVEKRAH